MLCAVKFSQMKEPIDYVMSYINWIMMLPLAITENSENKNVRRFGAILCIPFAATWIITGIPFLLCVIVFGIAQLWHDA